MKCKNCGSTIREGASFCLNCGAQVQAKKKGSAQGGVKALIIVLVCSLVLLSGVAAYAILSGRLGGNQTAPDAESGKTAVDTVKNDEKDPEPVKEDPDPATETDPTTDPATEPTTEPDPEPVKTKVPVVNVLGKKAEKAAQELKDSGLKVKTEYYEDDTMPEGCVISQSPEAGQEVEAGTEVTITVSVGKKPDAETAIAQLVDELLTAARNDDYEAFASHYINTSEEKISSDLQGLQKEYTDTTTRVLNDDGEYCLGFVYRSSCAGTYPNYRSFYSSWVLPTSWQDGKLVVDYGSESADAANSWIPEVPDEAENAANDGGNCARFGGYDFSWLFDDVVITGAADANLYLMWQNKDGSVDCYICFKNGTDATRAVTKTEITVTDNDTGETIISFTDTNAHHAEPGKSVCYTVHVPATEVMTGTEIWGSLHSSLDTGTR